MVYFKGVRHRYLLVPNGFKNYIFYGVFADTYVHDGRQRPA